MKFVALIVTTIVEEALVEIPNDTPDDELNMAFDNAISPGGSGMIGRKLVHKTQTTLRTSGVVAEIA